MTLSYCVDRLPASGLVIDQEMPRDEVAFLLGDLVQPGEGPFVLRLELHRREHTVRVDGRLELPYTYQCSRCAEDASARLELVLRLAFVKGREDQEGDIDPWAAEKGRDVVFYEGSDIDLTENITEQIVFAVPSIPLCKPDCKGLCLECGEDLNRGSCSCADQRIDPRFAKLKNLKV